jgi:hypothetical protein
MTNQEVRRKFEEMMHHTFPPENTHDGGNNGPVERNRGGGGRPEPMGTLTKFIVFLAAILGVMLVAYGQGTSSGFTFNNSERPAVECADLPDGGVMCRRPNAN